MPRNIDSTLLAALSDNLIFPALFVTLTFASSTKWVWTGVGPFIWGGNTYIGVGSLGSIGVIAENDELSAAGTTITLSGIDTALLQDCIGDIQLGAPASIALGLLTSQGQLIGTPYTIFAGQVDAPSITVGGSTLSITLALENKLVNLSRPTLDRYTSASQRILHPTDIGFSWVEQLLDISLVWGQ